LSEKIFSKAKTGRIIAKKEDFDTIKRLKKEFL